MPALKFKSYCILVTILKKLNFDYKCRNRLDAETKLCNWTLTEDAFKNYSLQKYFDTNDDSKKKSNLKQGLKLNFNLSVLQ